MKNIDITKYLIPLLSTCFNKEDFCDSSEFIGAYFHNVNWSYDLDKYGVPIRTYIIFNKSFQEECLSERYVRYVKDKSFINIHQSVVDNKDCVVYEFDLNNALFYKDLKDTLTFIVDNNCKKIVENFWGITLSCTDKRLLVSTVQNTDLYIWF